MASLRRYPTPVSPIGLLETGLGTSDTTKAASLFLTDRARRGGSKDTRLQTPLRENVNTGVRSAAAARNDPLDEVCAPGRAAFAAPALCSDVLDLQHGGGLSTGAPASVRIRLEVDPVSRDHSLEGGQPATLG